MTGAGESRRLDAFVVSYSDEDPARAQRIANRLARVFVDEHSKSRAERAEDTSAFIGTELRASQVRLADLEAKLRKAKELYMGQLPEQTQANSQTRPASGSSSSRTPLHSGASRIACPWSSA